MVIHSIKLQRQCLTLLIPAFSSMVFNSKLPKTSRSFNGWTFGYGEPGLHPIGQFWNVFSWQKETGQVEQVQKHFVTVTAKQQIYNNGCLSDMLCICMILAMKASQDYSTCRQTYAPSTMKPNHQHLHKFGILPTLLNIFIQSRLPTDNLLFLAKWQQVCI